MKGCCVTVVLMLLVLLPLAAEARKKNRKNPEPPHWKGPEREVGSGPVTKVYNVGQSMELDCSARGRPKPRISWFKNGAQLAPSDVLKTRRFTLSIKKVQRSDSGNYTCKLRNKEGELERSYIINVKTGSRLLKVEGPRNITALEGETVSFRCRVLNDPTATIKWMVSRKTSDGGIDSSPTATATFLEMNLPDPEVLVLRDITAAHAGQYTCMTGNEWGLQSNSAYLTVNPIGVPPSVSQDRGFPARTESTTQPTLPPFMPDSGNSDFEYGTNFNQDFGLDRDRGRERDRNKDRKRNRDRNGNGRNRKKNRRPSTEEDMAESVTTPRMLNGGWGEDPYRHDNTDSSHEAYDPYPMHPNPRPDNPVLVAGGNQTGMMGHAPEGEGTIGLFTIYTIVGAVAGVILLLGLIAITVALCCRRDPNNVYKSTSV